MLSILLLKEQQIIQHNVFDFNIFLNFCPELIESMLSESILFVTNAQNFENIFCVKC